MDDPAFLHALCGFRPRTSTRRLTTLVASAGSVRGAWGASPSLLRRAGWDKETISAFDQHRAEWNVSRAAEALHAGGITLVPLADATVPPLLREISDPPLALYVRGQLPGDATALAVVGSRAATPYGRTVAQMLTRPLAARGITIVSGLAYGIDAEAHRATLAVHGRTVAILGSGSDDPSLYPRSHRGLVSDIVAGGGAVVSEFPPGTSAKPEHFPQRNRLIAGVSRAVIIVEASRASGALITARLAADENRDVFAVPGPITSPTSEGANRLLRDGASPALCADDILEALSLRDLVAREPAARTAPPAGTAAARVLAAFSASPCDLAALSTDSGLSAAEVASTVSLLELDGLIRDVGGKHYIRV